MNTSKNAVVQRIEAILIFRPPEWLWYCLYIDIELHNILRYFVRFLQVQPLSLCNTQFWINQYIIELGWVNDSLTQECHLFPKIISAF